MNLTRKSRREKDGSYGTSEEKVVIQIGNFDASLHQMEHTILIVLLEQITSILEESYHLLEVCIDGDLDSNKTLPILPLIQKLLHLNAIMAKNKKQNNYLVYR